MIFFKKVILGFREIIHKDPPKGDRMKKFSYKGGLSKMALFNGSVLARLNPARWLFNLLYIARRMENRSNKTRPRANGKEQFTISSNEDKTVLSKGFSSDSPAGIAVS
ncbi:MAG: hypothetical protein C6W57_03645 [Caldibacillus debilis]|nr:MAG: hypothetical protein C6W57_03645 [Caldibacillus debilis]